MSFSLSLKEELCLAMASSPCCKKSEALGILLYCNHFSPNQIRITTASQHFAQILPSLFDDVFHIPIPQVPTQQGKFQFLLENTSQISQIYQTLEFDTSQISHHIPFAFVDQTCCSLAFCRGAFLAGGSITDPEKSYHFELVTSHAAVNRELPALLHECKFTPKLSTRKGHFICYFKQATQIQAFLHALSAPKSAQVVQNLSQHKNLTSSVNRQVNCDAANLNKAVDAAQSQLKAIRLLEQEGLLKDLPEKLQETAHLRTENAHCTLSELAQCFSPPLSKSALNHRLRKLITLAENLKPKEEST